MRFPLQTLLIVLALGPAALTVPASVKAQWATTRLEHYWTVEIGEYRLGLELVSILPGSGRRTTVYLGCVSVRSNLRGESIVALIVVTMALLLAAVAISIRPKRLFDLFDDNSGLVRFSA